MKLNESKSYYLKIMESQFSDEFVIEVCTTRDEKVNRKNIIFFSVYCTPQNIATKKKGKFVKANRRKSFFFFFLMNFIF